MVLAIVGTGITLTVALGLSRGFDSTALMLLGFAVAFGLLAVAVARKSRTGSVAPATCAECGGVISPHAPYCKHCGTPT